MITSLEHWATSGLLFFSLLLHFFYLRLFYLILFSLPPPVLPLSHRRISSIRSRLPSSKRPKLNCHSMPWEFDFQSSFVVTRVRSHPLRSPFTHATGPGLQYCETSCITYSPSFRRGIDCLPMSLENVLEIGKQVEIDIYSAILKCFSGYGKFSRIKLTIRTRDTHNFPPIPSLSIN